MTINFPDQRGRIAVVTGANSGLGLVTATELAQYGAHVVLAVRNTTAGEQAARQIRGEQSVDQMRGEQSVDQMRGERAAGQMRGEEAARQTGSEQVARRIGGE